MTTTRTSEKASGASGNLREPPETSEDIPKPSDPPRRQNKSTRNQRNIDDDDDDDEGGLPWGCFFHPGSVSDGPEARERPPGAEIKGIAAEDRESTKGKCEKVPSLREQAASARPLVKI